MWNIALKSKKAFFHRQEETWNIAVLQGGQTGYHLFIAQFSVLQTSPPLGKEHGMDENTRGLCYYVTDVE